MSYLYSKSPRNIEWKAWSMAVAIGAVALFGAGCDSGERDSEQQAVESEEVETQDENGPESEDVLEMEPPSLTTYGELRQINLEEDYSPSVELVDAMGGESRMTHAVGALGELGGEITVWDDALYLGHAGEEPTFEEVSVDDVAGELDATILFGASVTQWTDVDLADARDLASLQEYLGQWRDEEGVDAALPFRITDPEASVHWHVVDGERIPEGGANSCDERKDYAHQFDTDGQPVRVAGLFTTEHTGVVVDHTTSIHAHVITDDGESGHIDELQLSDDAELEVAVQ